MRDPKPFVPQSKPAIWPEDERIGVAAIVSPTSTESPTSTTENADNFYLQYTKKNFLKPASYVETNSENNTGEENHEENMEKAEAIKS